MLQANALSRTPLDTMSQPLQHDHLLRHIKDEEYSQALARVVIMGLLTALMTLYNLISPLPFDGLVLCGGYFIYGLAWAAMVHRFAGDYKLRRLMAIITDLAVTSLAMYLLDSFGAALYPFYLWIIVGNGMRFGAQSLVVAMLIALGGFITATLSSTYWSQNIPAAVGLAMGLVVLPLFYLVLIKRLHLLNKQLELQLRQSSYAATHDGLTDLANRGYFFQRISDDIVLCERQKQAFAILFIDLDGFKTINDTFGHHYGDRTLKIVAARLKNVIRQNGLVCRLGGDEFGILLHGLHNPEQLRELSLNLIKKLSEPIAINKNIVHVTASIGISLYPNHGTTPDEILNKADQAMYRTKHKGKNGYTFYLEEVAIT